MVHALHAPQYFLREAWQAYFLVEHAYGRGIAVDHGVPATTRTLTNNWRESGGSLGFDLYWLFPVLGGRSSSTKKQDDALNTAHNRCPARIPISSSAAPVMWQRKSCPQSKVTA